MLLPCKTDAISSSFFPPTSLLCPYVIGTAATSRADKARQNRKPVQVRVRGCGVILFCPLQTEKINYVQFSLDTVRASWSSWNRFGFCFYFLDSLWQNSVEFRFTAWNRQEPLWKRLTLRSASPGGVGTAPDLTRNPCPTTWTLSTSAPSQLELHHRWDISAFSFVPLPTIRTNITVHNM